MEGGNDGTNLNTKCMRRGGGGGPGLDEGDKSIEDFGPSKKIAPLKIMGAGRRIQGSHHQVKEKNLIRAKTSLERRGGMSQGESIASRACSACSEAKAVSIVKAAVDAEDAGRC